MQPTQNSGIVGVRIVRYRKLEVQVVSGENGDRLERSQHILSNHVLSLSTWAAGDVDGDGDMDIYLVGSNGNPWYFENNSTSRLRNGEIDFEYLFFERIFGSSNVMNIPDFNNGVPRQVRASVEQVRR